MKNFILLFNILLFLFSCKEEKNAFDVAPNSEISSNSKSAPSDAESNTSNLVPQLSYDNSTGTKIVLGKQLYVAPSIFEHNGPEITHCEIKQGTTHLPPKIYIHPQTCVVYGTPSLSFYSTKFIIVARNKNGTSSDAILNLEVINASVPSLGYQNSIGKIGVVGNPMKVTPSSFHGNGSPVTNCFIQPGTNPLPASLSIHPNTCEIYGTPTSVYVSSYEFKIIASNLAGESLVAKVVLQVNPAPPSSASLVINNGDLFSNNTTVRLTPGSVNASQMYITNVAGCKSGGQWASYSTSRIWALSQLNSNAIVYVKFRNNIGEETECVSDTITHDNIPPSAGTMLINNGLPNTNSINVTISLSATEATEMYITNSSGCTTEGIWEKYVSTKNWSLGVTNAKATVYAKFRDAAGNESQCISGSIFHQSENLLANDISINSGDKITKSSVISLSVLATSASEMYVTNTPGCLSDGIWETYGTKKTWTLAQKNAVATVFVKFRNRYGNESSCISDSIIHDNIAPSNVSIIINNNALYTNLTKISLSLGASGAHEMYITSMGGCSVEGSWEPYNTSKSWTITNLNSTTYIYAKFRDVAGNESVCISKSITHDDQPPLKNEIYLNGNNTYTNSSYVQVALKSSESTFVYITNTPGCVSDGAWEKISQAKENWKLSQINSSANVYAKFRDAAGNESTCITDSIIHDNIPPIFPSISINNGDSFTNLRQVNLSLSVQNGSEMFISNSPFCSINGIWEKYEPTKIWTLEQTNMTVSVYVRFKDEAGNITSCINDNIIHDDIPPLAISISINNDTPGGTSDSLLNISGSNASEMYITNNATCTDGGIWETFSTKKEWDITDSDTTSFISFKLRDESGNESKCMTIKHNYTLLGSININYGSNFSSKLEVILTLNSNDATEMYITNEVDCTHGGEWEPFQNSKNWTLSNQSSLNKVFVKFRNSAGLESSCLRDDILTNPLVFSPLNTEITVTSTHKDKNGIIYLSGPNGLYISNDEGKNFSNRNTSNGLGSNKTFSVTTDINENIYVGTSNGLSISSDGGHNFLNHTKLDGLIDNLVFDVLFLKNKIYIATPNGLSISTDGGLSFINKTTTNGLGSNHIKKIFSDSDGKIYLATEMGLSISSNEGNSFISKTTADGLGSNWVQGIGIYNNFIYVLTSGGLSISTDQGNTFLNRKNVFGFLDPLYFHSIEVDSRGYIYLISTGGISVSTDEGSTFKSYLGVELGLPQNGAVNIKIDQKDNIYLSLGLNGLYVKKNSIPFKKYNVNGLTDFTSFDISSNLTNILYGCGGTNICLSTNNGDGFQKIQTGNFAEGNNVISAYIDHENIIYIGRNGNGLSISRDFGKSYIHRNSNNGLGNGFITDIIRASNKIYVATFNGLSISNDGGVSFTNKTTLQGLGSNEIRSIALDDHGKIFIGTHNGLSISDDGGDSFVNKTNSQGLGSNRVLSVHIKNGIIFVGTDNGLSISSDGGKSFINKRMTQGLGSTTIRAISSFENNLYVATGSGLSISTDGSKTFKNFIIHEGKDGTNANVNSVHISKSGRLFTTSYANPFFLDL